MSPVAKEVMWIWIIVALIFNTAAFATLRKDDGFSNVISAIITIFLWIFGLFGAIIGTIARKKYAEKEKKRQEKIQLQQKTRIENIRKTIQYSPGMTRLAQDIASYQLPKLAIKSEKVGPFYYESYNLPDIPAECFFDMGHALICSPHLMGIYRTAGPDDPELDPEYANQYRLILIRK